MSQWVYEPSTTPSPTQGRAGSPRPHRAYSRRVGGGAGERQGPRPVVDPGVKDNTLRGVTVGWGTFHGASRRPPTAQLRTQNARTDPKTHRTPTDGRKGETRGDESIWSDPLTPGPRRGGRRPEGPPWGPDCRGPFRRGEVEPRVGPGWTTRRRRFRRKRAHSRDWSPEGCAQGEILPGGSPRGFRTGGTSWTRSTRRYSRACPGDWRQSQCRTLADLQPPVVRESVRSPVVPTGTTH